MNLPQSTVARILLGVLLLAVGYALLATLLYIGLT